jgi:D-aminopeptidase
MTRLRDFGVKPGFLPTGTHNAITDVPGVRVGHTTLISGEGKLIPGEGPVRTGCTAILPHGGNLFREKVAAAVRVINGFGKSAGLNQIVERGTLETPILLTNTLNVGLVADGLTAYMLRENPDIGVTTGTVNPVVGECHDGFLNDVQGRHVRQQHVWQAIESASDGPVQEGNVGAGTGMACFQFKGGIGTASRRVLDGRFTLGALVQSNYGKRREMLVMGAPIGEHFLESYMPEPGPGSIIMVLATDAPLTSRQLKRLAMRAAFGLARTGSTCEDYSGDFVIAFSTTNRWEHSPAADVKQVARLTEKSESINEFFTAAVESVEEAIMNSMIAAQTMIGRDGNTLHAVPHDKLADLLTYYRRR